jgi:peptidyl-Asp metalloendopeptidase
MSLQHRILFTFLFIALSGFGGNLQAASLTLSWSDRSNNEDGFRIERMVAGGILAPIATVGTNVTSYTDANLTSGLSYCYIVRAFNSAGVSDASNAACAVAMDHDVPLTLQPMTPLAYQL